MEANIKQILEINYQKYNNEGFIKNDPISIPHQFKLKEDIEISSFFASTFAWGQRKMIIQKSKQLLELMSNEPYNFIMLHSEKDLKSFDNFRYRTFNSDDCKYFIKAMRNIYKHFGGLENLFTESLLSNEYRIKSSIIETRRIFLSFNPHNTLQRHFGNPAANSASKRINMFLRWMVRDDKHNVDFGIWKKIPSKYLIIPLDIHSSNTARELGLLKRKQNDWKAAVELTDNLKKYDSNDPVKYDFALFGIGVNKKQN